MSYPNYSLEVISHHPQFKNKSLRKYHVDGIDTVGAWGDEPFEIKFSNHTGQKVQVKISLDGTDVFTGEKATTDVTKDMWVVQPYGSLSLKAWPETNNGGAAFIFTSANNSVAVHTHGDLSHRGIIAAAVYVEGHVEPVRVEPWIHNHYHTKCYNYYCSICNPNWFVYPYTITGGITYTGGSFGNNYGGGGTSSSLLGSNTLTNSVSNNVATFNLIDDNNVTFGSDSNENSKCLESLASVGAGEHVEQKITYVTGLIKPTFTETLRVKYMWWDDLTAKLKESNVPSPHASGFPGDTKQINIDLKNTPRKTGSFHRSEAQSPVYSRI